MSIEVDIVIQADDWTGALSDPEGLCRSAIAAGWTQAMTARAGDAPDAELAIALADDAALAALNVRYRGKTGPTNVLSFESGEPLDDMNDGRVMLGDIAIAYGITAREASEDGKPLAAHLQHLVVHGLLHLLGYDHERDQDARRMEALEAEILERLGVANPYLSAGLKSVPKDDERTIRA